MKNDKFIETFKEEALELLGTLETTLLELEENPEDKELISAVFRVMHTIKGSAAMFGLDKISSFAHEVESILTALREGRISVTTDLIGNTLTARDHILEMLEDFSDASDPLSENLSAFLEAFRVATGFAASVRKDAADEVSSVSSAADSHAGSGRKAKDEELKTWHILFRPGADFFRRGASPLSILSEIRGLGETVCIPFFDRVPAAADFDPEDCATGWDIYVSTGASENQIRDIFIFVEDFSEVKIECLENLIEENIPADKKLGEILVDSGKLDAQVLSRILGRQKRIGEILVEEHLVSQTDLKAALEAQKQIQKVQKTKALAADMSTIRVKSEKLDQLMSLVGELVTVHARIQQTSRTFAENDELVSIVEQFGRLTDELRNNTMSIRMVPIGTTFSSFKRLVRDLSTELGKSVELETEGGETELDKTVIEKLNDPLIHIIRNSLDHGIESPEVRAERGKPAAGTIRLSATQTGASVHVTIEDDGNGLNKAAILKKAVGKGLIAPDSQISDEEIYRLIFAPGFSTKEQVTAVSGRGVGMDVVNRQMELINGSIAIESREAKGTRIILKIPLTLAIIDGLLVRIGEEFFIIPLAVVVGCLEFIQKNQKNDNNVVIFHDKQLPFVNMRDFFAIPGTRNDIEQIVVVNIKNTHVGILVDQVIGGNQTVIKPLGKLYKRAVGVSSGSILGDGSVALILDVEQIVDASEKAEND
ncbi:chemotaxis protein CheA [Treponema zuelzerae]|uniref:Chemotaxis protein CheA n=1 Tax=Teretinema zuelzerae TaxID=156 RepID=A0AAE3EHK2_9SPIR|nr:chemotaxis protein CheA [Teretinema zuelzerae]MCD1654345.1 chemotaxis protein CheA [Teretinema zuelzerae]HQL33554.1 chemotaxis protein CheA [Treponemataceae bacterium]